MPPYTAWKTNEPPIDGIWPYGCAAADPRDDSKWFGSECSAGPWSDSDGVIPPHYPVLCMGAPGTADLSALETDQFFEHNREYFKNLTPELAI